IPATDPGDLLEVADGCRRNDRGIREEPIQLLPPEAFQFIDELVRRLEASRWNATTSENRREHPAIGQAHSDILGRKAEGPHDVDRKRDDLRVTQWPRLADEIAIQLEVLPQATTLLPLIAEKLRNGEPADRLAEAVGPSRDHSGERGRHLGSQRHLPPALVLEGIELLDDLGAALRGVEIKRLQRRAVILLEAVAKRDRSPGLEDVIAQRQIVRIEVAKPRQGRAFHGGEKKGGRPLGVFHSLWGGNNETPPFGRPS